MLLWIVLLCTQALYVHSFTTLPGLMSRGSTSLRCAEGAGIFETREKRPRGIRYPVAPRPLFFEGRKEDFKGKGVKWDNPGIGYVNSLRVQADGLVYPQGEYFGNPIGIKVISFPLPLQLPLTVFISSTRVSRNMRVPLRSVDWVRS